ncbi:MAG: DUF167 family protein [Smithellaceae bacterium]|nr:DUF167 family protein [Smithellaceae bacterium]
MTDTLLIRETKNGLSFDISVNPHASRAQIAGIAEGLLKVKVTAPPVEGAANDACIELLAKKLGLKKSRMKISAGARRRRKTILLDDISRTELEQKLRQLDLRPEL